MSKEQRQISLTYTVGGECLVRPGKYTSAEVEVKHAGTEKEEVTVKKPLKVIEEPVIKQAKVNVTLRPSFVEEALQPPHKPPYMKIERWLKTYKGAIAQRWNTLTDEQKIKISIQQYVRDMNGTEFDFILA
jgi:hypothetical protein